MRGEAQGALGEGAGEHSFVNVDGFEGCGVSVWSVNSRVRVCE